MSEDVDDVYYFDMAIHPNKIKSLGFDIEKEENLSVKEYLVFGIEGSILGVKKNCVTSHLSNREVFKLRVELTKLARDYKIDNVDEFYRFMALNVPLDEA
jgi:hypothetical protein